MDRSLALNNCLVGHKFPVERKALVVVDQYNTAEEVVNHVVALYIVPEYMVLMLSAVDIVVVNIGPVEDKRQSAVRE